MKYIKDMKMDELHEILIAYEMRTRKEKSRLKEESFKSSKKIKG